MCNMLMLVTISMQNSPLWKLVIIELVNKFPAFYGTLKIITVVKNP
jgi:hypothetical protein